MKKNQNLKIFSHIQSDTMDGGNSGGTMAIMLLAIASILCSSSSSSLLILKGLPKPYSTSAPSKSTSTTKSSSQTSAQTSSGGNLPITSAVTQKGASPWNLQWGSTTNMTVQGNEIRVKNIANGYSTKSGTNIAYNPFGALPARGAKVAYEIYFEPGWCFGTKSFGGKIPGFEFGAPGSTGGSGGKWSPNSGSCRPMWGKDGALNMYIYYNKTSNTDASRRSFEEQATGFEKIASSSGTAGQRLWEKGDTFSKKFEIGKWHTIEVEILLNTPGKQDGLVALTFDGETKRYEKMFWRSSADQLVESFQFSVWHGGSDSGWGCPQDVFARFKNVVFYANR